MKRRKALKNTLAVAGATLSAPTLLSLLQSCASQERLSWKPVFLNENEARTVSRLVDAWLPSTNTPGALDVNVDVFVDLVFDQLYNDAGKANVRDELEKLNNLSSDRFGSEIPDLSKDDLSSLMGELEKSSGTFNPGVWGTAVGKQEPVGFYRSLKSTALWGYFSSEEIGKNVLNYDPIPGEYKGCIPLSEVGNSWSL